jgi:uncharacterized protein (TIGR02466 family)
MIVPSTFYYWGPLLWQTKVSDEIINGLLERGLKSNVSHRHKLVGYFKDEYAYSQNDMEWFIDKTKPYFLKHKDVSENEWYMAPSPLLHLSSLWINIMRAGDFNPPHTHDGELSFVIYLKVPPGLKEEYNSYEGRSPESNGAGIVTFIQDLNNRNGNINRKSFLPEVGDMFIFPATLTHFVAPFKCEGERISVSGNLIVR